MKQSKTKELKEMFENFRDDLTFEDIYERILDRYDQCVGHMLADVQDLEAEIRRLSKENAGLLKQLHRYKLDM